MLFLKEQLELKERDDLECYLTVEYDDTGTWTEGTGVVTTLFPKLEGIDPSNTSAVVDMLSQIELPCRSDGMMSTIAIDGVAPGEQLRSEDVNANVSAISAIPEVREKLIELQRSYLKHSSVVMEGRDIGSVVFPDTPYKIYVDADEAVRAKRRGDDGEVDSIAQRDAADSKRATAPLVIPEGATVLDNSNHTIESGLEAALEILRNQGLDITD